MKIGINPLPWVMDSDFNFHLDTPTLAAAFEELKAVGFTAVQADVPEGMDAAAYDAFLDEFGLPACAGIFRRFFR
jgi:inosose dehydratase